MAFLPNVWLNNEYGIPFGAIIHKIARPIVVSVNVVFSSNSPASFFTYSVIRTLTRECNSASPVRYAFSASRGSCNNMPSPLPFTFSRVI